MTNPHETAARERKAAKLLWALDLATAGRGENPTREAARLARVLRAWGDDDWARLAKVAGCRPPKSSRAHVIAALEARAELAARIQGAA